MRLSQMLMMAAAGNQGGLEPPEFISAGALATTTSSSMTVGVPSSYQAGDLLLMFASFNPTQPSGWSTVYSSGEFFSGAGNAGALKIFSKIASASESSVKLTVTPSPDYQRGVMIAIRGWSSIDDADQHYTASGTSCTLPVIDTVEDNSMVIYGIFNFADINSSQLSSISNASLTGLVERFDQNSSSGDGGGLAIATGIKESAGSSGSGTATIASSTQIIIFGLVISPEGA